LLKSVTAKSIKLSSSKLR